MKIICIMPVYNCADVILASLQSIDGKVDEIRCFDGRWVGHEGSDYSTDLTERIIKIFGEHSRSKVFYNKVLPMREWESKNKMIENIEDGDWIYFHDSDEVILEWENVRETLNYSIEGAYRVCCHMFKSYAAVPNAKFFKKTEGVHFDRNHREIFDGGWWIDVPHAPIIHIVYDHMPEAKTKKDRPNMKKYETENFKYEQGERGNQSN
jgi:glycosyltransferase involved in cell wall biosynthesis